MHIKVTTDKMYPFELKDMIAAYLQKFTGESISSGEDILTFQGRYENRQAVRAAIDPPLSENREIFQAYGPENEYRCDPESELAHVWRRKVLSRLLPNNRRVLAILDANRHHLTSSELETLEEFRQHVDDFEVRHLGEGASAVGRRFPGGMQNMLIDGCAND